MKFEKFCTFKEGYVNPSQKVAKYFDGPIKWLRATDLNNSYVYNTSKTLSTMGFQSAGKSSSLFKPNSLAISKSGTIGRLGIIKDFMCGNRAVINIEVDQTKMNMLYIFYWLMNKHDYIVSLAVGSVQKNLYVSMLKKLDIENDNLLEQEAVVKILSSLDKKIENNTKINQNLEKMAQAIFKHWFVDFEFPDENGNQYKSSGGEMIESELGKIPEGWKISKLADISEEIITGRTPSTKVKQNYNGNIPFVKIPDMHNKIYVTNTESYLSENGITRNKLIPKNSVMVSCIATPGLVSLTSNECQTNQQINTIICKRREMCYFTFLQLRNMSNFIRTLGSSGSTTLNLNKREFSKLKIIIPPLKLETSFYGIVDPLFKKILMNQREINKLKIIRDTLLPKLMSGEIRVPTEQKVR